MSLLEGIGQTIPIAVGEGVSLDAVFDVGAAVGILIDELIRSDGEDVEAEFGAGLDELLDVALFNAEAPLVSFAPPRPCDDRILLDPEHSQ